MSQPCQNCDGHGAVLLMNSWFINDGYRSERCAICEGTGKNPRGYTDWGGGLAFQRRARKRIALWGRQVPVAGTVNPDGSLISEPSAPDTRCSGLAGLGSSDAGRG